MGFNLMYIHLGLSKPQAVPQGVFFSGSAPPCMSKPRLAHGAHQRPSRVAGGTLVIRLRPDVSVAVRRPYRRCRSRMLSATATRLAGSGQMGSLLGV